MSKYLRKSINLDRLLVNIDNPRFNPVKNQNEAISTMLANQNDKLFTLIKDILDNGLNPSDSVIVTPRDNNYIVLEGNRRVTALKLLNNPELIKDIDGNAYNKFKKLLSEYADVDIKNVDCVVFENEVDANKWISLKHTGENGGKGTVTWDSMATKRFSTKLSGKKSIPLQIIDFIKSSEEFDTLTKEQLENIPVTNIERLFSDPNVRETIGFTLKNGLIHKTFPDKEIAKGLSKIISDLYTKNIVVKDIYSKEKRIDYLSSFNSENLPVQSEKLNGNISLIDENSYIPDTSHTATQIALEIDSSNENHYENKESELIQTESLDSTFSNQDTQKIESNLKSNLKRNIRDNKHSYERKYVIPSNFNVKVSNKHVNDIYKELKLLEVDRFTNAVAVLLRVFIELSLDEYISKENPNEVTNDSKLNKKLQWVLDDLKSKKLLTDHEAKPINKAVSSPVSILSINTFNSYVHNKDIYPSGKELKVSWNNLERFVQVLWENI